MTVNALSVNRFHKIVKYRSSFQNFFTKSIKTLFSDRYFQCEPMDATVSPIALTNHGNHSVTDNSNPGSSNPGTPAPNWVSEKNARKVNHRYEMVKYVLVYSW